MADAPVTGVLRGNTITLDAAVPPFEGWRVRVIIAPEDLELAFVAFRSGSRPSDVERVAAERREWPWTTRTIEFNRQGLAHEFDCIGSFKRRFTWTAGTAIPAGQLHVPGGRA
jgi:hypothetical protein